MNPSPKLQALNVAKLLLEGFVARNEPSLLGDAMGRAAHAYEGGDASYPIAAAFKWMEALRNEESKK